MDVVHRLCGGVIERAIIDYLHEETPAMPKSTKKHIGINREDARDFLFTGRLDKYIDFWALPLNPGYVRRKVNLMEINKKDGNHGKLRDSRETCEEVSVH